MIFSRGYRNIKILMNKRKSYLRKNTIKMLHLNLNFTLKLIRLWNIIKENLKSYKNKKLKIIKKWSHQEEMEVIKKLKKNKTKILNRKKALIVLNGKLLLLTIV